MEEKKIPFSPPDISEAEITEVVDTLRSGWITTGPKTKKLESDDIVGGKVKKGKYWLSATQVLLSTYTVAGLLYSDGANELFFPAAGLGTNSKRNSPGAAGYYCSSTINSFADFNACYFSSASVQPLSIYSRYYGFSVRPVSD